MRSTFFRGVVLGSATAVLVLSASAALAGTGIGGIFNLGKSNTVNATSSLSGSTAGAAQLSVSNSATGSGARGLAVNGAASTAALLAHNSAGPAAAFQSAAGFAPFSVNSTKKVTGLNADLLDGIDSSALQTRVSGTCPAGSAIGAIDSLGGVTCQTASLTGYEVVTATSGATSNLEAAVANCSAGKTVIGGGGSVTGLINSGTQDGGGPRIYNSSPTGDHTGWVAGAISGQSYSGQFSITAYAICVTP